MAFLNFRLAATVIFVVAAPLAAANATDAPIRKAGLWTVTVNGPSARPMPLQTCVGSAQEQGAAMFGAGKSCTMPPKLTKVPGGVGFHTICQPRPGVDVETSGTAIGDFQSAYTVKAVTAITPAPQGSLPRTASITARWVGACPAGMNPGDSSVGGRIIHRGG